MAGDKRVDSDRLAGIVAGLETTVTAAWDSVRRVGGLAAKDRHRLDEQLAIAASHIEALGREVRS